MDAQLQQTFHKLAFETRGFHGTDDNLVDYRIGNDILYYLLNTTDSSMTTLETGAGFTTAVLALQRCQHTAIAPSEGQFKRVQQWCEANSGSCETVTFIKGKSQHVLPQLTLPKLDLVIIDGAHEFPMACLDFAYTVEAIKVGGRVVIDDIDIPAVGILVQFLIDEQSAGRWNATHGNSKTLVFQKMTEFGRIDWFNQPFNKSKTRQ